MLKSNFQSEETLPFIVNNNDKSPDEILPLLQQNEKIPYPKAVLFVLCSKLFEAFAANGIRTILVLYLRDALLFSENLATIFLHIFNFFSQFCPIFGAILADNYIGNAQTISYFFILYAFGWIGIIIISFPMNSMPIMLLVSTSLLFISIGNGSIRACVTTLGAIQFKTPEQNESLNHYFSHYYFVYYIGIFLSKILPPIVRSQTKCFSKDDCYPAVFGTLGGAFGIGWIIFLFGRFFYRHEQPAQGNVLVRFFGCVKYALIAKLKTENPSNKKHWLQHSIGEYSEEFVQDSIKFLKICILFTPLPIYWALLAQQDSSWTFQATQMNTNIFGLEIQPDQAKAMGPIFLFTIIPIWQYIIYPIMNRFGFYIHPLHSVAIGGLCSALAFVCSGLVQLFIECETVYKSISILWQIPQFILLMMGELFLSIPGLKFAFTQAPASMKSVLTATWFLNNAIGNFIVVVITNLNLINLQSSEYFLYAILMFSCIIIFTIMACDYLNESHI